MSAKKNIKRISSIGFAVAGPAFKKPANRLDPSAQFIVGQYQYFHHLINTSQMGDSN
jgi:hypothetical protein